MVRNDAINVAEIERLRPEAIVLSPGPCSPTEAGTLEIVSRLHEMFPILGICLGHQAIGQALGGRIVRAREPIHGRVWPIQHAGRGIFAGLPNPLAGCRYDSLVVERDTLPAELEVTAWTADGTIMALGIGGYRWWVSSFIPNRS